MISLAIGINTILRGINNLYLYRKMGATISLVESTGLAILNTLGNLLPLSGGLIAKGAYLKRYYHIDMSKYLCSTLAVVLFQTTISGLIALVALAYICYEDNFIPPYYLTAGLITMSATFFIMFLPIKKIPKFKWMNSIFITLKDGWAVVCNDQNLLFQLACLHTTNVAIEALRFYWIFATFSTPVSYQSAVLFSATGILTRFVNLAPGGIGVREAIIGGLSIMMGLDFSVAVMVVVFDRIVDTLLNFLVAVPFSDLVINKRGR